MIKTLVILGASGNLTTRFLLPAFVRLHQAGRLTEDFRIIGIVRDEWDTATFRCHVEEKMTAGMSQPVSSSYDTVLAKVEYFPADVTNPECIAGILRKMTDSIVVYLALPPGSFSTDSRNAGGGRASSEK